MASFSQSWKQALVPRLAASDNQAGRIRIHPPFSPLCTYCTAPSLAPWLRQRVSVRNIRKGQTDTDMPSPNARSTRRRTYRFPDGLEEKGLIWLVISHVYVCGVCVLRVAAGKQAREEFNPQKENGTKQKTTGQIPSWRIAVISSIPPGTGSPIPSIGAV